jgi:hypothetical protein
VVAVFIVAFVVGCDSGGDFGPPEPVNENETAVVRV